MNSDHIVASLKRQMQLLAEFRGVSEEQGQLIEAQGVGCVETLLQRRGDLILELTAIEATLGTWAAQIHNDLGVTPEMMEELSLLCGEILELTTEVVSIDEAIHRKFEEDGEPKPESRSE